MSAVLSNDPLSTDLRAITGISLPTPNGPGYGSASQQGHVANWNTSDGVRFEAAKAGYLTAEENVALKAALDHWPWLDPAQRKTVNRIITMLYTIRKRFGFADPDRTRLSECRDFQRKPKKDPVPRQRWRTSGARRARERSTLAAW